MRGGGGQGASELMAYGPGGLLTSGQGVQQMYRQREQERQAELMRRLQQQMLQEQISALKAQTSAARGSEARKNEQMRMAPGILDYVKRLINQGRFKNVNLGL